MDPVTGEKSAESKCSSSRGSQYLDLHRVCDLWPRFIWSTCLLRFAVFCQIVEKAYERGRPVHARETQRRLNVGSQDAA